MCVCVESGVIQPLDPQQCAGVVGGGGGGGRLTLSHRRRLLV